jgi:hypothetical protein
MWRRKAISGMTLENNNASMLFLIYLSVKTESLIRSVIIEGIKIGINNARMMQILKSTIKLRRAPIC